MMGPIEAQLHAEAAERRKAFYPRARVVNIAPRRVNELNLRVCSSCGKKMRLVRDVPVEGSGLSPKQRAVILQKMAGAERHTVADCITAVIVYLDIRRELVLSQLRAKPLARARQIAMWLARNETGRSLPEIGRRWGRDHSTVHHSCGVIDKIIATRSEPDVADAALALRDLFRQARRESA